MNKAQEEFVSAISRLGGQAQLKTVVQVTTSIECLPKEEVVLKNKIYALEETLMSSNPDTFYNFRVITSSPCEKCNGLGIYKKEVGRSLVPVPCSCQS
jgi:hypothetical protein